MDKHIDTTTNDRIKKTVDIAAPVERVWQALTDHREFGEWFRVRLDRPFVPGEATRGNVTHAGYEHIVFDVSVEAMEEPAYFAFKWHPYPIDPDVDYSQEEPTLVEFRLEPIEAGTRLNVVESGFGRIPAHRRAEAFRMNEGGWEAQVKNIKAHVET